MVVCMGGVVRNLLSVIEGAVVLTRVVVEDGRLCSCERTRLWEVVEEGR